MFAPLLLAMAASAANGCSLKDPQIEHRVVRIEVNACYAPDGSVRYRQIIFWDSAYDSIRCVDYRMIYQDGTQYRFGRRYVSWVDSGVLHIVRGLVHYTVTPVCEDPEVLDRKYLSTSHRGSMF